MDCQPLWQPKFFFFFWARTQSEIRHRLKIKGLEVEFKPGLPIYCQPPKGEIDENKWFPTSGFTGHSFDLEYEKSILSFEHVVHSDHSKWIVGKYKGHLKSE